MSYNDDGVAHARTRAVGRSAAILNGSDGAVVREHVVTDNQFANSVEAMRYLASIGTRYAPNSTLSHGRRMRQMSDPEDD
jgi:hypothetical protein